MARKGRALQSLFGGMTQGLESAWGPTMAFARRRRLMKEQQAREDEQTQAQRFHAENLAERAAKSTRLERQRQEAVSERRQIHARRATEEAGLKRMFAGLGEHGAPLFARATAGEAVTPQEIQSALEAFNQANKEKAERAEKLRRTEVWQRSPQAQAQAKLWLAEEMKKKGLGAKGTDPSLARQILVGNRNAQAAWLKSILDPNTILKGTPEERANMRRQAVPFTEAINGIHAFHARGQSAPDALVLRATNLGLLYGYSKKDLLKRFTKY